MSSEWKKYKIQDVAEKVAMGPFGSSIKVSTFVESGIPIISGQHLHGFRVDDYSGHNFITEEHAEKLKNANVKKDDVIFTHAGNIGQVAYIGPNAKYEKYVISQRQFYLRCDKKKAIPEFVVLYFQSSEGKHSLLANASQVGVPSIARPVSYLKTIEIPLPSIDEQYRISKIFTSLDDRIALLRETNATLESIAQAIFKSWFIDFDPVKAKQQGEEPQGMDAATAALFPDAFQDSELGPIPVGWRVGQVQNVLELAYGKALKATDRIFGDIPVYGSGGVVGYHNKPLVNETSVIVGRKGTVGSLYWEDMPFFPIDTVYYVKGKMPLTYCYYLLKTLGLDGMNTDAAVPGLNRNNVYRLSVIIPSQSLIGKFDSLVDTLRRKIRINNEKAQTLASIRDALLPRLISGKLRLPEAEAMVGEAGL